MKSSTGWEQERQSLGARQTIGVTFSVSSVKKYVHIAVNCPLKAQQSVRACSKPALIACSNPGEKLALRGYLEGKPESRGVGETAGVCMEMRFLILLHRSDWRLKDGEGPRRWP